VVREYVGGYDDWLQQRNASRPVAPAAAKTAGEKPRPAKERPRKLSFKEQQELDALPDRIAALEEEQGALHGRLSDPAFYKEAGAEVAVLNARLEALEAELAKAYRRWEELEGLKC
jgi:ATP-binding cassette subfamily F protein uup